MVEEFRVVAMVCSGLRWCCPALATTAQLVVASFGFSPSLWWCSVLLCVLFACVVLVVAVVVFVVFLNDMAVLCTLFQKKLLVL